MSLTSSQCVFNHLAIDVQLFHFRSNAPLPSQMEATEFTGAHFQEYERLIGWWVHDIENVRSLACLHGHGARHLCKRVPMMYMQGFRR